MTEKEHCLTIELKRALAPDEVGVEEPCAVCGIPLVTGVVVPHVLVHSIGEDLNVVCRACLDHLSRRNPGQFPTIEEYEEANRRYTEPVYASVEEITALERAGDPSVDEAYQATWITRTRTA